MAEESAMSEASGMSSSAVEGPAAGRKSKVPLLVAIAIVLMVAIAASAYFLGATGSSQDVTDSDDVSDGVAGGSSSGGGSGGGDVFVPPEVTTTTTTTTLGPKPFTVSCNFTLMADTEASEILSDNYPNKYRINLTTFWCIRAPYGFCIKLVFLNFSIEQPNKGGKHDYLAVFDGGSENKDHKLLNISGQASPQPVTSSGPMMTLLFVSDSDAVGKGFKLEYSSVPCTHYEAGERK